MANFGRNLRRMRIERGWTQDDLAAMAETSKQVISRYENEQRSPKISAVARFAEIFGVSVSEMSGEGQTPASAIRVPVLGTIPAGVPLEAIEEILDWEEVPLSWGRGGKEFFALKISGDSMAPRYEPGDVIICRRQEKCESGQDAVVMVNSDDATFKRVRVSEAGIALQPLNPAYDPLFFTAQQVEQLPVRIIGVAVEIRRTI